MKKNLSFVTATEAGILVAVKTKLSRTDLDKVENNTERVKKLLEDVHAVIVFFEPEITNDFNFCIGSYSSGEVSTEAIRTEEENMVSAMDQLKDWLKTVPVVEPAEQENNSMTKFKIAVDAAFKTLNKHFPDCGFCIIGANPEDKSIAIIGDISPRIAGLALLNHSIADENS